ncbi:MAG: hypothetical protein B6230_07660 [Desulfobacteraceae bacterium 4572_89]|nr:MAG: hypothetical protein B6230_07660 [Desulfobacteraceae bacterium 4572_89]
MKYLLGFFLFILMSLGAIWGNDAITQSPFFSIEKIDISGNRRLMKNELLQLAGLAEPANLFKINTTVIEKKISNHPWIAEATVKRSLFSTLVVEIVEHEPLAIVNIENLADIIINTQGQPFKEYDPKMDRLNFLPVISGVDLTCVDSRYLFEGPLFNSIMDFLKIRGFGHVSRIMGDENTGITIETKNIYNGNPISIQDIIPIKLGFNRFEEKQKKAEKISTYIDKNFPDKTISAMDLFDVEKVFVKIKDNDALHNNLEKGV